MSSEIQAGDLVRVAVACRCSPEFVGVVSNVVRVDRGAGFRECDGMRHMGCALIHVGNLTLWVPLAWLVKIQPPRSVQRQPAPPARLPTAREFLSRLLA